MNMLLLMCIVFRCLTHNCKLYMFKKNEYILRILLDVHFIIQTFAYVGNKMFFSALITLKSLHKYSTNKN